MEQSHLSAFTSFSANPAHAFDSVKPELDAVLEAELVHINVDIPTAITVVLRSLRGLGALRPKMEGLADFDLCQFDKLETYTLAALHANHVFNVVSRPEESLPALLEEATRLRNTLYCDVQALIQRGLLCADDLRQIRVAHGYRPLASDLGQLAVLLRLNWEKVAANSAVIDADLERATSLSMRIFYSVAQREQQPTSNLARAALDRQRAYTLLFRAYDQARRAVGYLRWRQDDVETLAPSLHAGRNRGKRRTRVDPGAMAEPSSAPVVSADDQGAFDSLTTVESVDARPRIEERA